MFPAILFASSSPSLSVVFFNCFYIILNVLSIFKLLGRGQGNGSSAWAQVPGSHVKVRHGSAHCSPSAGETETGEFLGLPDQPGQLTRNKGSMRYCLNYKIEFDGGRYQHCPLASFPVCKHIHTETLH